MGMLIKYGIAITVPYCFIAARRLQGISIQLSRE
jgi:hypothetical protein